MAAAAHLPVLAGAVEKALVTVASRKAAPGDLLHVAQQVRLKTPVTVASRKYTPGDLPLIAAMPRRELDET